MRVMAIPRLPVPIRPLIPAGTSITIAGLVRCEQGRLCADPVAAAEDLNP